MTRTAARVAVRPAALPRIGPAVLTMGVFDGIHRGHRAMLEATRNAARELAVRSVALVFDPHPDEVLRPGTRVPRLAAPLTNVARIEDELGVDHAPLLRFDDALRQLTAEEFLAALAPAIALRGIVMSPESAFGRGRGGTVARLREIGAAAGFVVITVDPVLHDGEPISSHRVREAIEAGNLALAADLGSPARLEGVAVERDGRIGLDIPYLPALPPAGRYAAELAADDAPAGSVRVTIGRDGGLHVAADGRLPAPGSRLALELRRALPSTN